MRTRSQRLLSMVLALSMLLTFLPVSAFADDSSTSAAGNTYPVVVSGEGTYTYTLNDDKTATLTKFTGTTANVPERIEKDGTFYTVTTIGKEAFVDNNDKKKENKILQSVNLPNTITEIGSYAFYYCTKANFTSTIIPDGVTEIGDHAFYYCENANFTSIKIPDGVTEIKEGTFGNCTYLNDVALPKDLKTIGNGAFVYCSALQSIKLPEGLTTVEDAAFSAAGLADVTLPKSLIKVGNSAFWSIFNNGTGIQTVTYTGTKKDWDKLVSSAGLDNSNNYNTQLTNVAPANFHCAHTVTFDANGHGTAPEEQEVQYGEKAEKPKKDPTEDGFTFKGWYTAAEGGEAFDFTAEITEDKTAYAQWEKETTPDKPTTPQQPGTTTPTTPPESTDKPGTQEKPNPNPPESTDKPTDKPNTEQTPPSQKPEQTTLPEVPAVEEDDTAAIGYAAAAVTAAFVGWGAYRIGSEVYLKYLLPKDVLLPQNRLQLAELLWEDAGRPAPADAAPYADVDANDTDARQAARWAVEKGLLTLPDAEKPEEFAPYRSVSYAKSARAWNKAQQLKENAAR